jgi:hypothetical protein
MRGFGYLSFMRPMTDMGVSQIFQIMGLSKKGNIGKRAGFVFRLRNPRGLFI